MGMWKEKGEPHEKNNLYPLNPNHFDYQCVRMPRSQWYCGPKRRADTSTMILYKLPNSSIELRENKKKSCLKMMFSALILRQRHAMLLQPGYHNGFCHLDPKRRDRYALTSKHIFIFNLAKPWYVRVSVSETGLRSQHALLLQFWWPQHLIPPWRQGWHAGNTASFYHLAMLALLLTSDFHFFLSF